tara:strand:+ start:4528 stop:5436 length:909 start_codon:yes stop_codon:yes gene_type:complete
MTIKIATRSSKLALLQVDEFLDYQSIKDFEIIKVTTKGDKLSDEGKTQFDKLNFISDIEKLILRGEVDVAIHSAKDLPAIQSPTIAQSYFSQEKQIGNDVLIFRKDLDPIFKEHLRIGTSSLRRQMQAKHHLNASNIVSLNGNVTTRLKKLDDGICDCIILAEAGLRRLDLINKELNFIRLQHYTNFAQGTLAVQWKTESEHAREMWSGAMREMKEKYNLDMSTYDINRTKEIKTGHEVLKELNADCNSAIALEVKCDESSTDIVGEIYGRNRYIYFYANKVSDAIKIIKEKGGLELLNEHN